ncbi:hypothetical protein [Streptomyces violaceus]|uniref:Uncharacterized protein n=1 Tax=Streptomyces violaceus TaxID=1936 RepID=A0ABY9UE20_STRVL|nr:hypothetical protein [Streptomyces janthinus]WND21137.1 hypothetical protein RI060_29060 [Streptomyces janthinus]GGS47958.1 hypothetical protein GCM10010270_17510 [Streptomyces janthinus]
MTACELCGEETGGRYLCERHTVALAKRLADLPTLYAEVGECLVPRGHGWGEIVATRGAAGPRSPLDEDVLDTVNGARAAEVVHLWRVDVQRVRWPQHGAPPPAQLAADCRWLAMELEWIVDHYPGTGDLAREVGELEKQARTIVGDPPPRPQRLGTCVAVDSEGVVCGAVITRLPGQTRVQCRWCRYTYDSERDWLLLEHFQPKEVA